MSARSASEETELHARLLQATLAVDESRAYWGHVDSATGDHADTAFEQFWFGEKTQHRVRILLRVMQSRFGQFPQALDVLHRWRVMAPETRAAICHWHVQLSDPLYRAFTGDDLVERRSRANLEVSRRAVVQWVGHQARDRWSMSTRTELASRLLSTAHGAGLASGRTDPRQVAVPRVPDDALLYLLHLLRTLRFEGTILSNPYLRSVGLEGPALERRLGTLTGLRYRREGDAIDIDIEWAAPDLRAWATSGPLAQQATTTVSPHAVAAEEARP